MFENYNLIFRKSTLLIKQKLVFVKDASLFFTNRSHKRRRGEIVIMSAKHEAERSEAWNSTTASEGAIYKT